MKIEDIKPKQDNVLVRFKAHASRREELEQTPGGIYIPKVAEAQSQNAAIEAVVIAVGPGRYADEWKDHEQGTSDAGSSKFLATDSSIVPGARVLLSAAANAADRVYDDEWNEFRMIRSNCVEAVLEE